MWTSTLKLDAKRVLLTQLIGRFYRDIYFSAWAPLQVQNLPRQPLPSSNWVRVRNRLAGICGSDLHLVYGDGDPRISLGALPVAHDLHYPGHELIGEVIEIGDHVQRLNVGDRVTLRNGPNCLSMGIQPVCRFCTAGNYNLCEYAANPGLHAIGGGWSEELLVHEQQLFPLPTTINDEQAVMLEPMAVAVHAVLRHLPQPGEHVLIIGAGTIGLLMLQILHVLAPQAQISVMARHPFQVEQATRLGANHILYPHDAYAGVQRATGAKLHHGQFGNQMLTGGYDVIYDSVGQKNTLHHALRWVRAQGSVVLVGVSLHLMHIDLTPIWNQEIDLIGSMSHGMETWPLGTNQRRSTFSVAAELIQRGQVHPERLITHHFALDNFKHALVTAKAKNSSQAIKVVFDYSLLPASVVPNVRASSRQLQPAFNQTNHVTEASPENVELKPSVSQPQVPTPPRNPDVRSTPTSVAELNEQDLLNAMSYPVNNDTNEDTATALPVVSRHLRALPTQDGDVATQRIGKRQSYVPTMSSVPPGVATHDITSSPIENTSSVATDPHQTIEPLPKAAPSTASSENLQTPTGLSLLYSEELIAAPLPGTTPADPTMDENEIPFALEVPAGESKELSSANQPEIHMLSYNTFPVASSASIPVVVEDEVQPDSEPSTSPEMHQSDAPSNLIEFNSDETQEFVLPTEYTHPSQASFATASTSSVAVEETATVEEPAMTVPAGAAVPPNEEPTLVVEPAMTVPAEAAVPPDEDVLSVEEPVAIVAAISEVSPDEEVPSVEEPVTPIATALEVSPDEEAPSVEEPVTPIATASEVSPEEETTVAVEPVAEFPVEQESMPLQMEAPSTEVEDSISTLQQIELSATEADSETTDPHSLEEDAGEIVIVDKDAETETKGLSPTLPFVEETPTVRVQPRPRPRKKR